MPNEVVREITRLGEVRMIPQAPACAHDLINLRGEVIPLIDLHVRFVIYREKATTSEDTTLTENAFALITEVHGNYEVFCGPSPNLPDGIIIQLIPEKIMESNEVKELSQL